jgi:hypothetical protein
VRRLAGTAPVGRAGGAAITADVRGGRRLAAGRHQKAFEFPIRPYAEEASCSLALNSFLSFLIFGSIIIKQ